MAAEQLHDLAEADLTPNVVETPQRADQDAAQMKPSVSEEKFLSSMLKIQKQITKLACKSEFIEQENKSQKQRLDERIDSLTRDLQAEKEQVYALKQRLAASEEASRLAREQLQQMRAEMERSTANIQQRQDATTATLQRVDEYVGVVEATAVDARQVASRAQETATQIAAKSEGFFAKTDRNEARLNRLQQTLSSADTLQIGTRQVQIYDNQFKNKFMLANRQPTHREEPDYLPENVQVGLKELGKSLTP